MSEIKELANVILSLKNEMDQRFDVMDQRFDAMDQRFDAMNQRFETMDQRFDAMDQRFDAMDQRFDAMDQRFDAMDQRINDLENGIIVELRGLSVALGIPEIWQKLNENEKRLENVESFCKIHWITPELADRLDCVEMVTARHTEQIDVLSRKIMGNPL